MTSLCNVVQISWFIDIKTNFFLYLVWNCSIIFFFMKETFFLSMEDNKEYTWNKPTLNRSMQCCPKIRILLKQFPLFIWRQISKRCSPSWSRTLKILSFFELELKLKMLDLFLPLKDFTEYILNQHWIGKHPMQCCPNRLIHINTCS